jgi:hypothetical protein
MAHYLAFRGDDGDAVLIEADVDDARDEGIVKAGVSDRVRTTLATAQRPLTDALTAVIGDHAEALVRATRGLSDPPDHMEVTFTLKATGEAGNIAVGRLGGEANYNVKLTWEHLSAADHDD